MRAFLISRLARRLAVAVALLAALALPAVAAGLPFASAPCHDMAVVAHPASPHALHAMPAAGSPDRHADDHGRHLLVHPCCALACVVAPPLLASPAFAAVPAMLWEPAEPRLPAGEAPVQPDPPPRTLS